MGGDGGFRRGGGTPVTRLTHSPTLLQPSQARCEFHCACQLRRGTPSMHLGQVLHAHLCSGHSSQTVAPHSVGRMLTNVSLPCWPVASGEFGGGRGWSGVVPHFIINIWHGASCTAIERKNKQICQKRTHNMEKQLPSESKGKTA